MTEEWREVGRHGDYDDAYSQMRTSFRSDLEVVVVHVRGELPWRVRQRPRPARYEGGW